MDVGLGCQWSCFLSCEHSPSMARGNEANINKMKQTKQKQAGLRDGGRKSWRVQNEKMRVGPGELFEIFHPAVIEFSLLDFPVIQFNKFPSFFFLR